MGLKRKKIVRGEMKKILSHLDARWVNAASGEVCIHVKALLESLPTSVEHILAWTSFFPGEVDLSRFIEAALERYTVYLPRVLDDNTMRFISIGADWHTTIAPGLHGIREPRDDAGRLYNIGHASKTAILIPGLAFDREGDRIGRGKGCYDRFLMQPEMIDALKIGICFSLQMVVDVPIESHDTAMDWVVHEEGFISCSVQEDGDALL